MSGEDVEVVRDSLAAFADGGLDGLQAFWHPDIRWRAIEGALDDVGEMFGIAAAQRYLEDWVEMFDGMTNVPERLIDVGDGRVVARQIAGGRAKLSGVETELRYALVYTIRERTIERVQEYAELDEALRSVGLAP